MKPQLLLSLLLAALLPMTASAQSGEGEFPDLFNTSAAYDILAVFPQADKLAEDPFSPAHWERTRCSSTGRTGSIRSSVLRNSATFTV